MSSSHKQQKQVLVSIASDVCYLLTVIGCILLAGQFVVGPPVQIGVVSTQEAIASKPDSTHTLEQGLGREAEVNALGILVAGVCVVFARVVRFTHLQPEQFVESTEFFSGSWLRIEEKKAQL